MADEAFALSPIHARASLLTDADYDAICDAFMETARGRWFLGEYTKRNRNADTRMVLDAVERIEATLASQKQAQPEPVSEAKPEADLWPELINAFTKARIEIAQRLVRESNEQAFEAIRSSVETIKSVSWALRERGFDSRLCDVFDLQVNAITDGYTGLMAESSVADEIEADVLAAFDALMQHVEALTQGGEAGTAALDAVVDAVADAMSEDDGVPDMLPAEAATAVIAAEPEATPAANVEPVSAEIARDPDAEFHEIYGDDGDIEFVEVAAVDEPAVAAVPTEPEINKQRFYEAKLEPYRSSAIGVPTTDDIEIVDTASAEAEPAPPPAMVAAVVQDAGVAASPPAASADQPKDQTPALSGQASLGQALIANGVIQNPVGARADPLAPFRRMSQAEKVAFFT